MTSKPPEHFEPTSEGVRQIGERNPFADGASITISVPETVEVKLVDASTMLDYEVWSAASAIALNFFVGFIVAFCQEPEKKSLLSFSVLCITLCVIFGLMGWSKRRKLYSKTRTYKMKVSDLAPGTGDSQ